MKHTSRLLDGVIHVYELAGGPGELAPAARIRPVAGDEPVAISVTSDLGRVCYTTLNAVVCVSADGSEVWRHPLEPHSSARYGHRPDCAYSPDDRTVWVYRPDVMADRSPVDLWVVLDAATGGQIDGAELETAGHGGSQYFHPTDGHVLLELGEGQDGVAAFRGRLEAGRLEVVRYPWHDRCLIDLSPDGTRFMTVDHGQADVTFHRYPGGEEVLTLAVEDFGPEAEDGVVEWGGGFLSDGTAVVTLAGEDEETEQEWHRDHLVDLATGSVTPFASGSADSYDITPLGDGSWLLAGPTGHPVRCTQAVRPSVAR
ncbi:hypothetical protein ACIRBX_15800 [Kitasatospora sp. NPDC096147]|uniref:hypothetical protein n=1 Tax=Kitasatospora sp. NPDC096147 TaxID=3364093 RepID=UPI0038041427